MDMHGVPVPRWLRLSVTPILGKLGVLQPSGENLCPGEESGWPICRWVQEKLTNSTLMSVRQDRTSNSVEFGRLPTRQPAPYNWSLSVVPQTSHSLSV